MTSPWFPVNAFFTEIYVGILQLFPLCTNKKPKTFYSSITDRRAAQREIFTYKNLLNLPLQSQSGATSLALELLYIIINLSLIFKSHSETCRECLLWSPAVSISLINKTQQYGAVTRMQMSPDRECKLVCSTGRRCRRGQNQTL